jgi:predicted chitinase
MNKMMRKYAVSASRLRGAHFLAQVGHETGWWQYRVELGNERYFRTMYEIITAQEAAEDYPSGLARRLGQVRRGETEQAYAARRPGAVLAKAAGMDNGAANAAEGGRAGDGPRFRGRGFLQITGRRNYAERANHEADGGAAARNVTRVGGIVNRGSPGGVPLHDDERQLAFTAIWERLNDVP